MPAQRSFKMMSLADAFRNDDRHLSSYAKVFLKDYCGEQ
jgi:hypothetical protein